MDEHCSCPCGCTRTLMDADDRKFGKCWPCYASTQRKGLGGHINYQAWQAEQIARGEREAAEEAARDHPPGCECLAPGACVVSQDAFYAEQKAREGK